MGTTDRLVVGRIVKPHGIKGQVEIFPLTDSSQRFKPGAVFHLVPPTADMTSVTLTDVRYKKGRVVARLETIEDRESAKVLVGRELTWPSSESEKPQGAYWLHEIIGCDVETVDGVRLGQVSEILRTGSNDVYVIEGQRGYMIPAIKQVIQSIDPAKKIIVIKPMPGLLEL